MPSIDKIPKIMYTSRVVAKAGEEHQGIFYYLFNKVFFYFLNFKFFFKNMTQETARSIIKQLETMIIFQKECLDMGNWSDYDKAANKIKKLEEEIIYATDK
jgi:hypothetical protein